MADNRLDFELLADLKADQGITWDDPDTDRNIRNYALNGMAYIDGKLGEPGDYKSPGTPRMLLFEYVRYGRAAALDVFEHNYQHVILNVQNERRIARYAQENAVSSPV